MTRRQRKKQESRPSLPATIQPAPIEVARSFQFKLNCGNRGGAQFESMDFFQSAKSSAPNMEAAAALSDVLYGFCRAEVIKAVKDARTAMRDGVWEREIAPHPIAKTNAEAFERRQQQAPGGLSPALPRADFDHRDDYRK